MLGPPQVLKRKAEERNPDEFYFSMEKKRTKDGVHDGRCALRRTGMATRKRQARISGRSSRGPGKLDAPPPSVRCNTARRLAQANKYTAEELALMRSQDVKYLSMKAKQEARVRALTARCCPVSCPRRVTTLPTLSLRVAHPPASSCTAHGTRAAG